jgi:hypothetical protein
LNLPRFLISSAAASVSKSEGGSKKAELKNVKPYQAAKHYNLVALKLHGKEESGIQTFCTGLTHFLSGGCMGGALAFESL